MKKIKIQSKQRKRTYDEIWVPEIKMEGKWLEKLGFKKGAFVTIEAKKQKIVIRLDKKAGTNK
jgi:toxic protein SymE